MGVLISRTCAIFGFCGGILLALALPPVAAGTVTACTALELCYCVNADIRGQIDANVARVRQLLQDQRKQGKAIGYLSIPLSTAGGSYFGVNQDVAQQIKDRSKSVTAQIRCGCSIPARKATCRRAPPAPTIC